MNGTFYIGATGLGSQQRALDVIANNIANINTVGFKRSEVRFSEMFSERAQSADLLQTLTPRQASFSGVAIGSTPRVFSQGDLRETGRPLDIAVSGQGFLELMDPRGVGVLWRGGTLSVDRDGLLTGQNGYPLKAMITVPDNATSLKIDQDGRVHAILADEPVPAELGRIELALVRDLDGLTMIGEGLYQPAADGDVYSVTPGSEGSGILKQGSVETANVALSDEMVTLLLLQRAYAANAQVVQAGDQLMAIANGLKR